MLPSGTSILGAYPRKRDSDVVYPRAADSMYLYVQACCGEQEMIRNPGSISSLISV